MRAVTAAGPGRGPSPGLGPGPCSPLRTIVISEILALSQGIAFCLFLLFLFSFPMSSRHPSSWPVRKSARGPPVVWTDSTEAAGNCCSHSHKTSVLKKEREPGICFICHVTLDDVLRCNHMFVKLFVPCKLMNQTILGFQSAFASENVFASIRGHVCFPKWVFCNLHKMRL